MRSTPPRAALIVSTVVVAFGAIGASPCMGQTRVTSLEALRRELAAGDFITVVPGVGPPVAGRLIRFGSLDLEVRPVNERTPQVGGRRDVSIPLDAIRSLERQRDSARNGAAIGAGIGAGYAGGMFVRAMVIDRNEIDEWATLYLGAAAICTGIGALIGWAVDAAHSKPPVRFDASTGRTTNVSVRPMYSRRHGIALAVTFSR